MARHLIHPRCQADPSLQRVVSGNVAFPLGVYPIEPIRPVPGYSVSFESSDGGESEGDWEEWPDRYAFDVVVSADRIEALAAALFASLPGRIYPILDILGQDAYREIDPYVSYELLGLDRFMEAVQRFRPFFFEDGMCGFGAMHDDPFLYVFVDEHKNLSVRVEPASRDRIERMLAAFDLEPVAEPVGVADVAHEHRSVLLRQGEGLGLDQIVEQLIDDWQLTLNVDVQSNVDDRGRELGVTYWRCVVRGRQQAPDESGPTGPAEPPVQYAEIALTAASYAQAEQLAFDAAEELFCPGLEPELLLWADRLLPARFGELIGSTASEPPARPVEARIWHARLLE